MACMDIIHLFLACAMQYDKWRGTLFIYVPVFKLLVDLLKKYAVHSEPERETLEMRSNEQIAA